MTVKKIDLEIICYIVVITIIFALISSVALVTPMHSDDFPYTMIGIKPEPHIHHYMTWSGRVVADYASTIMLSIGSHTITALINSLASALLIYNISMLPKAFDRSIGYYRLSFIAIIAFLCYWVSNPNLGQVMFWIVGSANYLWTTLAIIFFIRKSIEYREIGLESRLAISYIAVIGIIAGWTNENTSVTTVLIMLASGFYYKKTKGSFGKVIITGIISSAIGAAAMILAPGNFIRANGKGAALDAWRESSIIEKFYNHVFKTMPDVFSHTWVAILLVIIALSLTTLFCAKKRDDYNFFAILFLLAFFASNMAMMASPGYPPRAMNGQLVFLICAISILLSQLEIHFWKIYSLISVLLLVMFIPSYTSMYIAYKQTFEQAVVRSSLINLAKSQGKNEVEIPLFYFKGLMKDGDKFDTYHSPYMAGFYAMKKITGKYYAFDYSVMNKPYDFPLNVAVRDNVAQGVYVSYDPFRNESLFIVEFKNPANVAYSEDYKLFVKPMKKNKVIGSNSSMPMRTVTIGVRHFTYVRIKNINGESVKSIIFGAYKPSTGEVLFETTINK